MALKRHAASCCLLGALVACGDEPSAPSRPSISAVARAYLNTALDIMQEHSINRYKIEWVSFRRAAFDHAGLAQSTAGTYDAIRFALAELGDNHSFFIPPSTQQLQQQAGAADNPPPEGERLGDDVGYVLVPWFSSRYGEDPVPLANELHAIIERVDTLGMCGWIVDLRGNGGGNMWPMLAGIGPVLGEGTVGSFIDPDSVKVEWYYRAGAAGIEPDYVQVQVNRAPYEVIEASPSVAVLTGPMTTSSGEAIVVAFRGRPKTRSFGLGTRGLSTANAGFTLSDGARILLTVSTFADRTGYLYGGIIEPDSVVDGWDTSNPTISDNVVGVARDWLHLQGDCVPAPYSPFD